MDARRLGSSVNWILTSPILTLLAIHPITPKPHLKVTYMKRRLLSLSIEVALGQLEQTSAPAQPNLTDCLADPKLCRALLNDRHGPFDVVAGQRHPFEDIP